MTKAVKLTLDVTPLRIEWCDRCLTTSLIAFDILRIRDTGVSLVSAVRKCRRCD